MKYWFPIWNFFAATFSFLFSTKKLFLIIIGCAIQQLAKKSKLLNLIQTIFLLGKSFAQNDRQFSPFMFCLMWMNPSDWVSQRCKNKISLEVFVCFRQRAILVYYELLWTAWKLRFGTPHVVPQYFSKF